MDGSHPLRALLQLHLASDVSAVLHLPHVISSLSEDCFSPSPHLSKWTTRLSSLLHSKDPGARWAGLCLAYYTAVLSRDTLTEHAQGWIGVALPLLSKNEPLASLKASVRLLALIFSAASGAPEFQRQVATPNVPKFTAAIITLADKNQNEELRVLIMTTLARLIPLFPTLHRASHSALSTLSLKFLNGSAPHPTSMALLEAATRLYANLHFTGGKVGAPNLWRKTVDETVTSAWTAFLALRTTSQTEENKGPQLSSDEAVVAVPLGIDRLRCCTVVLCNLLSSTVQRSIQLPLGPLVKFVTALLRCTKDDPVLEHSDPAVRAMEISIIPDFWKFGCDLISCLSKCAGYHLAPHLTRLTIYLTFHLEQKLTTGQRLFLLETVHTLLSHCYPVDTPSAPTRLAKAVLPSLLVILTPPPEKEHQADPMTSSKSKKTKKRARGYEGGEIFSLSRRVVCPSLDDGRVLFAALDVMRLLLRNHNLSPSLHSICSRVLVSILLTLPQMSPTLLSPDSSFHEKLLGKLQEISTEIGSGTTSIMSKSLGLVVRSMGSRENADEHFRSLEILLHPRMPPLLRSLPHVESMSLFRAEEPEEELETRKSLGLQDAFFAEHVSRIPDDSMEEEIRMLSPPRSKDVDLVISNPSTTSHTLSVQDSGPHDASSQSAAASTLPTLPKSTIEIATRQTVAAKPTFPSIAVKAPSALEEEDEEEMPTIDMESDSDID